MLHRGCLFLFFARSLPPKTHFTLLVHQDNIRRLTAMLISDKHDNIRRLTTMIMSEINRMVQINK